MSRPLAIARSHADAGVRAVLVVATDGREWAVYRVAGAGSESATTLLRGPVDSVVGGLPALLSGIDLVIVDAPCDRSRFAMRRVASAVGPVRLLAVDRALLNRFGAHRPLPTIGPVIVPFRRRRVRRWPAAVAAVTVVAGIAAGVLLWPRPVETTAFVDVGGVRVDIPGDWRRTDLAGDPAPRAVFVDPETGSRIVAAVSPLRADATIESVAASLGERIKQRGDDAVSEFAERAMFAGQVVVAYRETPDSGAPIRWYVRVLRLPEQGQRQVSVGCQDAGSPRLEQACRRAVASTRFTS